VRGWRHIAAVIKEEKKQTKQTNKQKRKIRMN